MVVQTIRTRVAVNAARSKTLRMGHVRGIGCSDDAHLSAVVAIVHHLRQQIVHGTMPLILAKHSKVDAVLATTRAPAHGLGEIVDIVRT